MRILTFDLGVLVLACSGFQQPEFDTSLVLLVVVSSTNRQGFTFNVRRHDVNLQASLNFPTTTERHCQLQKSVVQVQHQAAEEPQKKCNASFLSFKGPKLFMECMDTRVNPKAQSVESSCTNSTAGVSFVRGLFVEMGLVRVGVPF